MSHYAEYQEELIKLCQMIKVVESLVDSDRVVRDQLSDDNKQMSVSTDVLISSILPEVKSIVTKLQSENPVTN
jgi:hypothetical protein